MASHPSAVFLLLLFGSAHAAYRLVDNFTPSTLLNNFVFETENDLTNGFVNYVDKQTAASRGLTKIVNGSLFIGTDSTNVVQSGARGRDSVRIHSTKGYNHGLFLLDLQHQPGGICGTWPAYWMTALTDWPKNGEIDIIEGVNSQAVNSATLHTSPGCTIQQSNSFSGRLVTSNCDVNAAGQSNNAGCSIQSSDTRTYGAGFNAAKGGVYALEWTSAAIKVWFFPRSSIPADVKSGTPTPAQWSKPLAVFSGGCNIDAHFRDQHLIFDLTFCGDWAGNVWTQDAVCGPKASSCTQFVKNNPAAFKDAYWLINSLKVYQA